MDEQIIIDGVDVSGCRFLKPTLQCEIQQVFQRSEIVGIIEKPYGAHLECELSNPDCYYKQLQRAKKEAEIYYNYWIECKALLQWHESHEEYIQEKHFNITMQKQQLELELADIKQKHESCEKEYKRVIEENKKLKELLNNK